jgi:spore coat polysaccharide biosynthesis protein SpsF
MHLIIQARMSSTRLPGKILMKIDGRSLLEWQYLRLKKYVNKIDDIIIATSIEKSDDPVEAFCDDKKIACYRGSLFNTFERFKSLILEKNIESFVRICGDSPLIDGRIITNGIEIFQNNDFDLVTNIGQRSFPKGQSFEVIKSKSFIEYSALENDTKTKEHVTSFLYKGNTQYKTENILMDPPKANIQLSVDTLLDFSRLKNLFSNINPLDEKLDDIIKVYELLN